MINHAPASVRRLALALVVLFVGPSMTRSVVADVTVAPVFTDHMVLQRDSEAPLWGWARPGDRVNVRGSWTGATPAEAQAVAGPDGRWMVRLPTAKAGGPYTVRITTDGDAPSELTLSDVLLGDVWICSGQSNMEWPLRATSNAEQSIAEADLPPLRLLTVTNSIAARPQAIVRVGEGWQRCSPETAAAFSGVGYWFGRTLFERLGVPIGLVSADWGGTRVEAWTPVDALRTFPHVASGVELIDAMDPDPAVRAERMAAHSGDWWSRIDAIAPAPGAGWERPDHDDSEWSTMRLPATLSGDGLESFDGLVYVRRTVNLPAAAAGKEAVLELGPIDDRDDAWVNGVRVGGTREDNRWSAVRRYPVPAGVLQAGANTIAVRVLDTGGPGGINGRPEQLVIRFDDEDLPAIALAGDWRFRRGPAMGALPSMDGGPRFNQATPSSLYNGMIAPLVPMGITGVIWYQGESNRNVAALYEQLFPNMIRAWRGAWEQGDFPFYFVQIAPFRYGGDRGETADLRESQRRTLTAPATGMVVTTDVAELDDIHPRNKRAVGERLARLALHDRYGAEDVVPSGPLYRTIDVEDGAVRVRFDHADGLTSTGGPPTDFQVAGRDRVFHQAQAVVEGDTVVVRSPRVPEPIAVRFGYTAVAVPNLVNGAGLPASPFRSDDWPRPETGWVVEDLGRTSHLDDDPAFVPIFNGRDLAGWTNVNCAPSTWTVRDGVILCSGIPTGELRTDRMYENFVLELEFRHLQPKSNAGLFVWSDAITAPGQPFTRAIEVQVMDGLSGDWYTSDGDIFPIHGARMTPENGRGGDRAFPTEQRMLPAPAWNHYRVECVDGTISLAVNGAVVTRGRDASPRKGYICLESEGSPIEFRNLRVKELPPASPPLSLDHVATADEGFRILYNGVNLDGWVAGDEQVGHWVPANWILRYDGKDGDLWTDRPYTDFQMIVDWRLPRESVEMERPLFGADGLERRREDGTPMTVMTQEAGDSGIYLRGNSKSQVNIWCWPCGSGEVWGYRTDASMPPEVRAACTPTSRADRPLGEWNRFLITMRGDRLRVELNGTVVIEDAQLPGVPESGPIGLQSHGDPIEFANIYVRELDPETNR